MPKISALPASDNLTGDEVFSSVQSGTTKKVTSDQIARFMGRYGAVVDIVADYGAVADGVTDNTTAWDNFRAWAAAQGTTKIALTIPPGNYTSNGATMSGIKDLTIFAYGASIGLGFGARLAMYEDDQHHGRIQSVVAGSSTVTLVTLSDNTRFAVGDWVYVSGFDLMGFGAPPNHHFFEYKKITAINTGTGVITFDDSLNNSYLSTWPHFWDGDYWHHDQGGPATIYKMHPDWDCKNVVYGLTAAGFLAKGRHFEFHDCTWTADPLYMWPTVCKTHIHHLCSMPSTIEVDKGVEYLAFDRCQINMLKVQSSSTNRLVIDGCEINNINGTARNTVIRNTKAKIIKCGPLTYGTADSVLIENSECSSLSLASSTDAQTTNWTFANGTFTGVLTTVGPIYWATPGALVAMGEGWSGVFKVLDVRVSGSNIAIDTTLPASWTPPPVYGGAGASNFAPLIRNVRAVNSTGCRGIVDLCSSPTNLPYNFARRVLTGRFPNEFITCRGALQSIKVNVIRAYTGSLTNLHLSMYGYGYDIPTNDGEGFYGFNLLNLKATGERVLIPGSTTGTQTGDTLPTLGSLWFIADFQLNYDDTIPGGDDLGKMPIIKVEVTTSYGFNTADNWVFGSNYMY